MRIGWEGARCHALPEVQFVALTRLQASKIPSWSITACMRGEDLVTGHVEVTTSACNTSPGMTKVVTERMVLVETFLWCTS